MAEGGRGLVDQGKRRWEEALLGTDSGRSSHPEETAEAASLRLHLGHFPFLSISLAAADLSSLPPAGSCV